MIVLLTTTSAAAEAAAAAREEHGGVAGELERGGHHRAPRRRRAALEQRRLLRALVPVLALLPLPLPLPLRAFLVGEVELQLLQVGVLERVPDPERRPEVHLRRAWRGRGRRRRGLAGLGNVLGITGGGVVDRGRRRRSVNFWLRLDWDGAGCGFGIG